MKKPAWRCLTNPTNFVGTGRFKESKYKRLMCGSCVGFGLEFPHFDGEFKECQDCKGIGKVSLMVGK